jgi:hypothetical protein
MSRLFLIRLGAPGLDFQTWDSISILTPRSQKRDLGHPADHRLSGIQISL